ncbi:(Dimethylallyl)adenosine tRNA methylthiotransferase MiaB [Providencia alcalifaciens]|nr:(Dimethylallyl)adenosine tRNA methylthiotransferase MiaB [Providencia alcalifaciens]
MNEYDSSKMVSLLESTHGYQLTDIAEEADLLLLNTCSIREKAQEEGLPPAWSLEILQR